MVSVIVPCYNAEAYIDRCITSILSQTYRNIELILVNDGSTDLSHQKIEARRAEIEEKLTRFVYIQQENQGVGAACSEGFSVATGDYLLLLDSDDLLLPESVGMQAAYLDEHLEYALVRTNGYYADESNIEECVRLMEVNEHMKRKEDIFSEAFDGTTFTWAGSYMIRMEVLRNYYPKQRIYSSRSGQNMQFLLMAAYHNRAGFIDVPLMKYVIRKESLSHMSSGDVLQRKLRAFSGYEDIRRHLIDNYFREEERTYWHGRTDQLYARCRMQLALEYRDKQLMKENYQKLKALAVNSVDDSILYCKLMCPFAVLLLRTARKVKRILNNG